MRTKNLEGNSAVGKTASIVIIVVIIAAAAVGGFAYYYTTSTSNKTVNVAFGTPVQVTFENAGVAVGLNQSMFSKQGVNLTWVGAQGGAAEMQAAETGQIQMGIGSTALIIQAISQGIPISIVGPQLIKGDFILTVGANSSINSFAQLKGGTIAVTNPNSVQVLFVYWLAKAMNWTYGKDIKVASIASISAEVAALKTGQVQALEWTPDVTYYLVSQGAVKILGDMNQFIPNGNWIEQVVFARNDFISSHPDTVKKVLTAFYQAQAFVDNNPQQAAQMTSKVFETSTTILAQQCYTPYPLATNSTISSAIVQDIDAVRSEVIAAGMINSAPPTSQLYTTQFGGISG